MSSRDDNQSMVNPSREWMERNAHEDIRKLIDQRDALAARLAEAERAILDLWRGQIRCGYRCDHSDNAAHVDGKVWGDVAARFQHVINPDRAADSADAYFGGGSA